MIHNEQIDFRFWSQSYFTQQKELISGQQFIILQNLEDKAAVVHDEDARHVADLTLVDVNFAIDDITVTDLIVRSSDCRRNFHLWKQ